MKSDEINEIVKTIKWENIKSLMGTCEYIPEVLLDLVSHDKKIRDKTYWMFDNHIVVQGELYEGAFYLVPFLIELLKATDVFEKEEIYDLLFEIGNGGTQPENIISYKSILYPFEYSIPEHNGLKIPLQISCRNAVLKGILVYVDELFNFKSKCRVKALELICIFEEHTNYIISILKKLIEREIDMDFKITLESYYSEFKQLKAR